MIASTLMCLAMTIFTESRGEPYKGQVAVASVVLNRVEKNHSDVCTEINKTGQFPWAKDKFKKIKGSYVLLKNAIPTGIYWQKSLDLAKAMIEGTEEVLPNIIAFDSKKHPEWKMAKAYVIGHHYFYREA